MPKFAVYYIPEETDKFYQLGSSVLGYDVRKRAAVPTPAALQSIPNFTDQWLTKAGQYGFHLTIGDAIDCELGNIARIEKEVEDILGCFDPAHTFTLTRRQDDFVDFWGPAVVLRYEPNDYLKILHAVIAARIHPLGIGSGYLRRYLENPGKEARQPYHARRILKFFSPTVFDSYSPHFSLLHLPGGVRTDEPKKLFSDMFGHFDGMVIRSICLLIQFAEGQNWQIHREFSLPGTQEGITIDVA
jgi:hypothetical protein